MSDESQKDRLLLQAAQSMADVMKWLRNRGYIGTFLAPPRDSFAHSVVLFGLPGEPACMAPVGSVLVWDGARVTVQLS